MVGSPQIEEYRKKGNGFVNEVATLWKLIIAAAARKDCGTVIYILDSLDECEAASRNLLLDALIEFYCAQLQEQVQRENSHLKVPRDKSTLPSNRAMFPQASDDSLKSRKRNRLH